MHVTLVNPPYPSGAHEHVPLIPLGLSYLAAVLEKDGYNVDVIDCQALKLKPKMVEDELRKRQPDIVGVTSTTITYKPALQIVKTAKEALPDCLTVQGGPHVTVMDEQTLIESPETDIIVRGEGERTMLELTHLMSDSNMDNLDEVAGLTFRKNKETVRTQNRPFIQNINELPRPAFKYFPLSKYRIYGKTILPIITSRGCPFQCTFCLAPQFCGKRIRTRSPKNVVDELEWLRDVYGADVFGFYDETFTFDRKRALEICEEIKSRKVDLPWDCRTRVDRVSKEDLAKMYAANCQLVHFGIESGSQEMLDAMKKGTTVEQNERAIGWAKEVGLSVAISVIVGYPGETVDMLKKTLDFIRKTKPDYVYVCTAIPYPGTELYGVLNDLGWEMSKDWTDYDEHTQVFRNPLLPPEKIVEARKAVYDELFTISYLLHKSLRKDLYSQTMTHSALNHVLRRIKIPKWVSANYGKLTHK